MTRDYDIGNAPNIFRTMPFYDAVEVLDGYDLCVQDAEGNFKALSEILGDAFKALSLFYEPEDAAIERSEELDVFLNEFALKEGY